MSQVFSLLFPFFRNRKWNLEKFKFSRLICDRFTRCLIWKISHCACTRNPPLLSSFIGAKETTIVCERERKTAFKVKNTTISTMNEMRYYQGRSLTLKSGAF
uniref:Uncharacterized protein n=1 Tax=Cacopsylla melanoneura TaxID=428564 RepID=A0A8D8T652_9HEMI